MLSPVGNCMFKVNSTNTRTRREMGDGNLQYKYWHSVDLGKVLSCFSQSLIERSFNFLTCKGDRFLYGNTT